MNVSSGGLSFDFTATNDNLRKVVEQSKKDIQGLADASKIGGAQGVCAGEWDERKRNPLAYWFSCKHRILYFPLIVN